MNSSNKPPATPLPDESAGAQASPPESSTHTTQETDATIVEEQESIPALSRWSSPAIPQSTWCASDFMVGVGMVIIQQKTEKIVLLYSSKWKYYFFPRGRKDVGETLQQAALREAYEESGYRVDFMPLAIPTRQPHSPETRNRRSHFNTESIYMTTTNWRAGRSGPTDHGGVYLTSWFVGQIPEDAVCESGTRMPDEDHFTTHLLSYEEVRNLIWGTEVKLFDYVWAVYQHTKTILQQEESQRAQQLRRFQITKNRPVRRP
ncbi:Diadenosine hexaphosphate hydrolase [Psilocybe cubensis]|uniref:Diadenosine hexaphosphate hydrolase n=2 Tax=Psilocybe cubensis TaxID=181762 RepID=A0ACB8GN60_PSICU|nr:Diadenosine hexaphosphate hydrolase [Psilocybe cubensis]KAH9477111.1 Diadenosine hexaphosphate hydrolase [Psilocybe cubensis]